MKALKVLGLAVMFGLMATGISLAGGSENCLCGFKQSV